MTENENRWLNGTDPFVLLDALYPVHTLGSIQPQNRQSRMYLLACARQQRVWDRLPGVSRALVELADGYADTRSRHAFPEAVALIAARLMHSSGGVDDLNEAAADLNEYCRADERVVLITVPPPGPLSAPDEWRGLAALVYLPFDAYTPNFSWVPRALHDVRLIHEVYGNPYQRVPFDPRWRTDTAVSIARGMHVQREFSGMPILADALQDAGCNELAILKHCRDATQVHARGCWVLDLVLNLR